MIVTKLLASLDPMLGHKLSSMDQRPPWHEIPWPTDPNKGWAGETVSADGASQAHFHRSRVIEVIAYRDTGSDWDGTAIGIVRVNDGRYVGWESVWGPTGSGFYCDAYGGDAVVIFAMSLEALLKHFTDKGRDLYRLAMEEKNPT